MPRLGSLANFTMTRVLPIALVVGATGHAADQPRINEESSGAFRTALPIEDDANLHDVQFVGSRHGWAVGDHGVIWHTGDGGESWTLQTSGVNCSLRSISFLSDRVGWVAGGGTVPFTRLSYGVV